MICYKSNITTVIIFSFTLFILLTFNSCIYSPAKCNELLNKSYNKQYDIIVVPGVPFNGEKWSLIMKSRVYWSKYLYDKGIAKNIMYSGSAVYSPYIEAEIMAMYAEAIGIPKEHILVETKAEHSTENIFYSYYKAKKLNFTSVALASDPYQTKALKKFIDEKLNSEINIIPIVYDSLNTLKPIMFDPVIDFKKAFVKNFKALPNRETYWERRKGTRGEKIDYKFFK
jgi:uncharacterized SAM-binding protein YcdF (DUF218 family)